MSNVGHNDPNYRKPSLLNRMSKLIGIATLWFVLITDKIRKDKVSCIVDALLRWL